MPGQELNHLAGHLQNRAVSIEVEPVHTLDIQANMPVQHLVDVHHTRHATSVHREGRLSGPELPQSPAQNGGSWEGALPPADGPARKFVEG